MLELTAAKVQKSVTLRPSKPRTARQRDKPISSIPALCRVAGLLLCLAGCQLLGNTTPLAPAMRDGDAAKAEPAAPEEISSDEEAGVQHLHSLMRCFEAGLAQKQLIAADDCLTHAERGMDRSNNLTRSHPDFEDLNEAIRAGRVRYQQAVEQERITQREQAIDALMARGDVAYNRANALSLGGLPGLLGLSTAATAEDLVALDNCHATLLALLQAGERFIEVPRYAAHAQQLTAVMAAIAARRTALASQLNSAQSLNATP